MNAATDCSASAPTPTATAITWTYSPTALPMTVSTATRRPLASARPTTNRTLGPGITITTNAVMRERQQPIRGQHASSLSGRRRTFATRGGLPDRPRRARTSTAGRQTYEHGRGAGRLQDVQTAALAALALNRDDVLLDLGVRHRGGRPPGGAVRPPRGRLRSVAGDDRASPEARGRPRQRRVPRRRRQRAAPVRRRRVHRARVHHRVSPLPAGRSTPSPRCRGCSRPAAGS